MKASFFRAIAFFTSAAVCACSVDQPSEPQFTKLVPELRSALLDAPDVVSRATTGELGRGEEDLLVRMEKQLPGFGGLYIANGQVRVYMKKGTALSAATVRNALSTVYSAHSNPLVASDGKRAYRYRASVRVQLVRTDCNPEPHFGLFGAPSRIYQHGNQPRGKPCRDHVFR